MALPEASAACPFSLPMCIHCDAVGLRDMRRAITWLDAAIISIHCRPSEVHASEAARVGTTMFRLRLMPRCYAQNEKGPLARPLRLQLSVNQRQEAGRYLGRMFVVPLAAEQSHPGIGLSPAHAAPWQSAFRPYVLVAPSCVPRPPEASTWITPADGMAGGAELAVPTFEQPATVMSGGIAPFVW